MVLGNTFPLIKYATNLSHFLAIKFFGWRAGSYHEPLDAIND